MSYDNRRRPGRRGGFLRTLVSVVVAATILILAAAAFVDGSPWAIVERAATPLAARLPTALPVATTPAPTAAPGTTAPTPLPEGAATPFPTSALFDREALRELMLELINEDREAAGLVPVGWDETATVAAQAHAFEMARYGYLSHLNRAGYGPLYRYSQAGGLDVARENVYLFWQRYEDGSPVPVEDWPAVVREAQAQFMDSPGHRDNILAPEHTHAGIGIAYNGETGDLTIDQLFVDDYLDLEEIPLSVNVGDEIEVVGELHAGASEPLLNVAYESFPDSMTVEELNNTGSFVPDARTFLARRLLVDDGVFRRSVALDREGQPGLYHVRVWVRTEHGTILASNVVVEVR